MSLDTITRVDGQVAVTVTGADVGADDGEMPSRIGRFFIFRQLGEGGMGRVFLGYDEELDRKLAIKLWHGARDHTMRVRVLREAQALARLSHPNVITVYEVGEEQGRVYLAMEYVEGETLRRWVEDKPRTPAAILARYVEAGRGLAAAHRAGILHRDFKP
jgi:serine/threonine protein kinase